MNGHCIIVKWKVTKRTTSLMAVDDSLVQGVNHKTFNYCRQSYSTQLFTKGFKCNVHSGVLLQPQKIVAKTYQNITAKAVANQSLVFLPLYIGRQARKNLHYSVIKMMSLLICIFPLLTIFKHWSYWFLFRSITRKAPKFWSHKFVGQENLLNKKTAQHYSQHPGLH